MLLMLKNDIHIHSIAQWQWNLHTVNSKKKKPSFRSQDNFQQHSTQMFTRMIGGKRKLKWSMFPLAPERFSCKIIALGVNEDFSSRTSSFVLLVLGFSGDGAMNRKVSTLHSFSCRWVYMWACLMAVNHPWVVSSSTKSSASSLLTHSIWDT